MTWSIACRLRPEGDLGPDTDPVQVYSERGRIEQAFRVLAIGKVR